MSGEKRNRSKRKYSQDDEPDVKRLRETNNNDLSQNPNAELEETQNELKRKCQPDSKKSKRSRESDNSQNSNSELEAAAGKILRVHVKNFMCHSSLEIDFNKNVNFIIGQNGSGKSAILTAITIGLGARANITSRGDSMKEFIKKGKNSATIDITLSNMGPNAYQPDKFGNSIIVHRTIGASTSYRLKSSRGEVVSTKKADLDLILSSFNIQVNNPICVMNQDVSRSFLVASTAAKKYEFFTKATRLDVIKDSYSKAKIACEKAQQNLRNSSEHMEATKKEVAQLELCIEDLESVETAKEQLLALQTEQKWAEAMIQERNMEKLEKVLAIKSQHLEDLKQNEKIKNERVLEIDVMIQAYEEEIEESNNSVSGNKEKYNEIKSALAEAKTAFFSKTKEQNLSQSALKRLKDDVLKLEKVVQEIERGSSEKENERQKMEGQIAKLEEELDNVQAMLRTKKTDQMHYQSDKVRLEQEQYNAKIAYDNACMKVRQLKNNLTQLQKQADDAITVYGPNVPRLLRRINEEFQRGRFKQKPIGPLGAYIKIKDRNWIPAIEQFISGTITSFCVDNIQDAKYLGIIMKEVFQDDRQTPQIIASKFFNKVHDVSAHRTYSDQYFSMMDVMDISDPVVANCLIDQVGIETVLLIAKSQEACVIMSDARKVPRNCKRAITQQADTFFPDPQYRTYGGKKNLKARYLQVSTSEVIQGMQEDLESAELENSQAQQEYKIIAEKLKVTNNELSIARKQVNSLTASQETLTTKIENLRDKLNEQAPNDLIIFTNELKEHQHKLKKAEEAFQVLEDEAKGLKQTMTDLNAEFKRARDLVNNHESLLNPIRDKIRDLEGEKERYKLNARKVTEMIEAAATSMQKATADIENHKRVLAKAVSAAENLGEKVDTERHPSDIQRLINDLKAHIATAEKDQSLSIDQLRESLQEQKLKYDEIIQLAQTVQDIATKQEERLRRRKNYHAQYKKRIQHKVQRAFESVLKLRKFKGSITIDHRNCTLELEVCPQNEKRLTNDAKCLSGGERSYSTVAFILALWDCTGLPFYFLDEFDVFMDKINRRIIMDILLDHTKTHPQSQFAFLTPLDTSHVLVEDYITIHQMEAPERSENAV